MPESEPFGELIKYTGGGYAGGLLAGALLDHFGFQTSGIGQWLVRTLSGEGESIFEGIFSIRKRISGASGSLAEAYGWGKLLGMVFPWIIDWGSRRLGMNVYGVGAFYIPYFYALSDQIGANISGFVFLRRREKNLAPALARYFKNPVMLSSLAIILIVPVGLLAARLLGFVPDTQLHTALETIIANVCWLPPLVGWLAERRTRPGRSG
ncbi:MAG TPA: hypothetical protein VF451_04580 [Acidobacteriota bacterium]